jgi:H+-transporting ATPase
VSTRVLATLAVVYGWYVVPIGWKLVLSVWAYALVAFVLTDFLKLQIAKLLEHRGLMFKRG